MSDKELKQNEEKVTVGCYVRARWWAALSKHQKASKQP